MMLSAGDGSRSSRGATAASAGLGSFFMPSLSATAAAESLVDVEQMRHHALADDRFSTLLSSKVSAIAIWRCSGAGLAVEELPRLAVVVGEALGAQPHLLALPRHRRTSGSRAAGDSRGPSPNEFGW